MGGGIVIFKKIYSYITGKSVKQRIYICIALTAVITLAFFTVKANFFDNRQPQTSVSENSENTEIQTENADNKLPPFKISFIDTGVLLGVVVAYGIHKIREKKRQRRL